MPISIKQFRRKSEKELKLRREIGPSIMAYFSKHPKQAFTAREIYAGIRGDPKLKPSGSFYKSLNALVKQRRLMRKGSYFALA